jgi:hypothetical protein
MLWKMDSGVLYVIENLPTMTRLSSANNSASLAGNVKMIYGIPNGPSPFKKKKKIFVAKSNTKIINLQDIWSFNLRMRNRR